MLILNEDDIQALITVPEAIETLRAAFRAQDGGQATNRPRERVRSGGGAVTLHLLGAAVETEGVTGFKAYTSGPGKVRFSVTLYNSQTGDLLCMMEADRLGQVRTGAATGLATDYLARKGVATVGVYGSGYQAETQLEAVCAVRKVIAVQVYSRSAERRKQFAARMTERLSIPVDSVESPEVAADANVLITATTARTPVLMREWIKPGTHINAAGANNLARRELADEVVRDAALVVVDSREQAVREATDLVLPVERGWLYWERVRELREIVAESRPGRRSPQEITLFKSLGIGLEDVAVGAYVYKKALEQGRGRQVRFLP